MKRRLLSTIAALSTFAALGLGAAPARADICGDIFDECELADGILLWNRDQFLNYKALDTATCQKMADRILAQCQAAVKAAEKCWQGQVDSVPKTAKAACKTEGDGAGGCNADFENDAAGESEEVAFFAGQELICCEARAEVFVDNCREGFPPL